MAIATDEWIQSFQFSQDIQTLEDDYQQQHHAELRHQLSETPDEALVNRITAKLAQQLQPTVAQHSVPDLQQRLNELQRDNTIMAKQIETLYQRLAEKDRQIKDLAVLPKLGFQKLWGQLYFKR